MNNLDITSHACDAFRHFYQLGDSLAQFSRARFPHFNVDSAIKIAIASLDLSATLISSSSNWFSRFKLVEGTWRCIEIARSCYLLYTHPPGLDQKAHRLQILMNILNIGRLALEMIIPSYDLIVYGRLAIGILDTILKASCINQRFNADLAIRAILHGSWLCFVAGTGLGTMIVISNLEGERWKYATATFLVSAYALNALVKMIFNDLHIQGPNGSLRRTFVILGSALTTVAASTLLGKKSLTDSIDMLALGLCFYGGMWFFKDSIVKTYRIMSRRDPIIRWGQISDMVKEVTLNIFRHMAINAIFSAVIFIGRGLIHILR